METIEELAKRGEQHDVMDALRLLTKAYIEMCGISYSYRTVVYCAAERWQDRLEKMDHPLAEMARKEPLVLLMPYITSEYIKEEYDDYDIAAMDMDERLDCCKQIVHEQTFDEQTLEVMCWGTLECKKLYG